jgi:hypothetical protein
MALIISAIISGVLAGLIGHLAHSAVAGFAAVVVIGGVQLAFLALRGRGNAGAVTES